MISDTSTHQDLLEAYVDAELGLISERSGSISIDAAALRFDVRLYAAAHGLTVEDAWFEAYIL